MITIKEVSVTDATILALLGRVTYSESHAHFINNKEDLYNYNNKAFSIQKITDELKQKDTVFWIAFYNGFPVGYAKLVLNAQNENIHNKNVCRLERIYVLNEFLGQKIGYKLYTTLINKAKELNFNQLWLTTYIKNEIAIKFYKKQSFKIVGNYTFLVNGKAFENFVFSKQIKS